MIINQKVRRTNNVFHENACIEAMAISKGCNFAWRNSEQSVQFYLLGFFLLGIKDIPKLEASGREKQRMCDSKCQQD